MICKFEINSQINVQTLLALIVNLQFAIYFTSIIRASICCKSVYSFCCLPFTLPQIIRDKSAHIFCCLQFTLPQSFVSQSVANRRTVFVVCSLLYLKSMVNQFVANQCTVSICYNHLSLIGNFQEVIYIFLPTNPSYS